MLASSETTNTTPLLQPAPPTKSGRTFATLICCWVLSAILCIACSAYSMSSSAECTWLGAGPPQYPMLYLGFGLSYDQCTRITAGQCSTWLAGEHCPCGAEQLRGPAHVSVEPADCLRDKHRPKQHKPKRRAPSQLPSCGLRHSWRHHRVPVHARPHQDVLVPYRRRHERAPGIGRLRPALFRARQATRSERADWRPCF